MRWDFINLFNLIHVPWKSIDKLVTIVMFDCVQECLESLYNIWLSTFIFIYAILECTNRNFCLLSVLDSVNRWFEINKFNVEWNILSVAKFILIVHDNCVQKDDTIRYMYRGENLVSCKNLCSNLLYMYIYNKICSNQTCITGFHNW